MTTLPKTSIQDVLRRIYDGRRQLNELAICPDFTNARIVIAEELHAEILLALSKSENYGAIQHTYTCDGSEMKHILIIFGVQVEVDSRLMPHEIRFRSEVSV